MEESKRKILELREKKTSERTADNLYALAQLLVDEKTDRAEAKECCYGAISLESSHLPARLLLAKLFYLDEQTEFCLRELRALKQQSDAPTIDRLIEAIGANSSSAGPDLDASGEGQILAELQLDSDFEQINSEIHDSEKKPNDE